MNYCSDTAQSKQLKIRTQPWLGTFVRIAWQDTLADGDHAVDSAFNAISEVHQSMSFQDAHSELSKLNRTAQQRSVQVSASLYRVLHASLALAKASNGCFDPSVAGRVFQKENASALPMQDSGQIADWRDVELRDDCTVSFRRPLCLDLSGIAKGFAIDKAIHILQRKGIAAAIVNAGGDIRTFGLRQTIYIKNPDDSGNKIPLLELESGAVATSGCYVNDLEYAPTVLIDGATGAMLDKTCSVTVTAQRAIWADALTKVVLARREFSAPLLKKLNASAMLLFLDGKRQQIN